ncbi:MAG TPA: FkbM family methyltransferase [Dongiaceae bacterium]|nr:FkbM family methyltransferase [Dongiaceae bacterium]
MTKNACFNAYLDFLGCLPQHHPATAPLYGPMKVAAHQDMLAIFGRNGAQSAQANGIGDLQLPYFRMGNIDSVNLFDIDELIIFSFYRQNAQRYRRALDIGANIGLHSIVMAKLGIQVSSYEPDPIHYDRFAENVERNGVVSLIKPVKAAVSDKAGKAQFVRVLGNTTGSHLAGAKSNPYGDLERFDVDIVDFRSLIQGIDLIKLDAEGEEAKILLTTDAKDWATMDAIVEIGNAENAKLIFDHFQALGINLFSQKNAWSRVPDLAGIPSSYKEGSLFISSKSAMPWNPA